MLTCALCSYIASLLKIGLRIRYEKKYVLGFIGVLQFGIKNIYCIYVTVFCWHSSWSDRNFSNTKLLSFVFVLGGGCCYS